MFRNLAILGFVAAFFALGSCKGNEPGGTKELPKEEKPVVGVGSIFGKVKFGGVRAMIVRKVPVTKDKEVCGVSVEDESLVVGKEDGLRWVVVSLAGMPAKGHSLEREVVLDQKGCHFQPHVVIVGIGHELKILNPDGILHNFHAYSKINPPINIAQPKFKKVIRVKFENAETFRAGCDVHNWMSGWIVVAEHPFYAVTGGNGEFRIENIPAGKYRLKLWHETLGEKYLDVEVEAGKETKVDFKWLN